VNVIGAALELVGTSEGAPIRTAGGTLQDDQGDIIEPNVLGDGTAGVEAVRNPPLHDALAGVDVLGSFAVDGDEEPDWQENALCAQTDPEAFFPEKGGSTREAKRICSGCDVRAECLEYALAHDERFGIWGGLSERERRRLRRAAI
jgi:WhiB family transcriptional regulator, redox-sensing transcriptional regulator